MEPLHNYVQKAFDNGWTPPDSVLEVIPNGKFKIRRVDTASLVELKAIGIVLDIRGVIEVDENGEERQSVATTTYYTSIFNQYLLIAVFGSEWKDMAIDLLANQGDPEAWFAQYVPADEVSQSLGQLQ